MYAASYACDVYLTASCGGRGAGNRTGCRRTVDPGKYLLFAWRYGEGKTRDGAHYGGSGAVRAHQDASSLVPLTGKDTGRMWRIYTGEHLLRSGAPNISRV